VGYLQFETGLLPAVHSPEFSSRLSLTEASKLAVAPRLEFLVTAEPVAHFTAEGITANRVADIFVGAQFVLHHGEGSKPTLAVSYFHRVYDGGAPEFDFGSPSEREPVTIEQAWQKLIADSEARKLHESTIRKYRLLSPQMKDYASLSGLRFLTELDIDAVGQFRCQ
jgi:hypothetical protein